MCLSCDRLLPRVNSAWRREVISASAMLAGDGAAEVGVADRQIFDDKALALTDRTDVVEHGGLPRLALFGARSPRGAARACFGPRASAR